MIVNCTFSFFLLKLIELDDRLRYHNEKIESYKESWQCCERALNDDNLSHYMDILGLRFNRTDELSNYELSKKIFFGQMVEMKYLLDQTVILFDVFLNYRLVIGDVDFSKKINISLQSILEQVSIYPKRLTLLKKHLHIQDDLFDNLNSENWLNQSVQNFDKGLLYQLVKLKRAYGSIPCGRLLGVNKNSDIISESMYKEFSLPAIRKIETIIEYLYAPKLGIEISFDILVQNCNYPTDDFIAKELSRINVII